MDNEAASNGSASAEAKVRINFDVSAPVKESLDGLTERMGTTKAEILRRAILLMEAVIEEKERTKGGQLAIVDKNLNVVTRIVGY